MKAGWKTTEFWVTALVIIASLCGWIEGKVEGPWAVVAAGISAAAYAGSRAIAKKGAATNDAVRQEVLRVLGRSAVDGDGVYSDLRAPAGSTARPG